MEYPPGAKREGGARNDHHDGGHQGWPPLQRQEKQRVEQVELRFDSQRPGVEEGLQGQVVGVEVIHCDAGEEDVRTEDDRRSAAFGEKPHVFGKEDEEARQAARQKDDCESRNDATDATLVEREEREASVFEFVPRDGGDQKSRNDEEDVDPDIASRQRGRAIVIENHEGDRDGSETVDVGPVASWRGSMASAAWRWSKFAWITVGH